MYVEILTVIGASIVGVWATKKAYIIYRTQTNNKKRERKKAKKESSIQAVRERCKSIKSSDADKIVNLSLFELRNAINSGRLRPTEVLRAYQVKSLEAHDLTNCIVEYIKEAEEWAVEADLSDGRGKLLHGVPISIKDDVPLKGYDCTMGLIELCEMPMEIDCTLVQLLRRHGAIPFCKTNIPQFEMAYEVNNDIFGETCNPHDTTRGPGGSSGGESALIAGGGSVLGIGSDIGGSIRNPSNFTGLCGFKPTAERYSLLGHESVAGELMVEHESCLRCSWGPMARDMESVILVSKILLDGVETNKIDPLVSPLPFNERVLTDKRPLRIGYFDDNGLITSVPAVKRAVHQAKKYLERQGHMLVPATPPEPSSLGSQAFFSNGGEELLYIIQCDQLNRCVHAFMSGAYLPEWLRPIYAKFVELKDPIRAELIREKYQRKTHGYLEICAEFRQYRRRTLDAWKKLEIDAIICPAGPYPATPLNSADKLVSTGSTLSYYNVLNFPAGVVRMTRVTEQDDQMMSDYPAHDLYHQDIKQMMKGSVGLPVGVQVVAPWYEDELCLRIMKEMEGAADFHVMDK